MLIDGIGREVEEAELDGMLAKMGVTCPRSPQGYRLQYMLQPAVEIDVQAFIRLMLCGGYSPNAHLYEQLHEPDPQNPSRYLYRGNAHYYVFQASGYVLCALTTYASRNELAGWFDAGSPSSVSGGYAHGVRFFRIGCSHKNRRHETRGAFQHFSICADCGHVIGQDSSG